MDHKCEEKLKKIIASCEEGVDISKIVPDTNLVEDFDFTSISIIQLVVQLESEFDIEISDDDLLIEKLSPYRSLLEIVQTQIDEKINTNTSLA